MLKAVLLKGFLKKFHEKGSINDKHISTRKKEKKRPEDYILRDLGGCGLASSPAFEMKRFGTWSDGHFCIASRVLERARVLRFSRHRTFAILNSMERYFC